MNKIKNIYLGYWFSKLDYNPAKKVGELAQELGCIINTPLIYNNNELLKNISLPRIEGLSKDKKYLFTMSLVNAFLSINITNDIDNDELILLINNNIQLFYDILKNIYGVRILYTSIKLEYIDEDRNSKEKLINLLNLSNNKYEDLSFKRGMVKDYYYINYLLTFSKEYNFNIKSEGELSEQDLLDSSMLISLSNATLKKEFLLTIIEINDRYAYNIDANYETKKENIRGMIIELKDILNKELYKEI